MKVGNYVLYTDYVWKVVKRHRNGNYQIERVSGHHLAFWANMEVSKDRGTVIKKEVADVFIASNTHVTNN